MRLERSVESASPPELNYKSIVPSRSLTHRPLPRFLLYLPPISSPPLLAPRWTVPEAPQSAGWDYITVNSSLWDIPGSTPQGGGITGTPVLMRVIGFLGRKSLFIVTLSHFHYGGTGSCSFQLLEKQQQVAMWTNGTALKCHTDLWMAAGWHSSSTICQTKKHLESAVLLKNKQTNDWWIRNPNGLTEQEMFGLEWISLQQTCGNGLFMLNWLFNISSFGELSKKFIMDKRALPTINAQFCLNTMKYENHRITSVCC